MDDTKVQLPQYRSHKTVEALKIDGVYGKTGGGADLCFEDTNFAPITVSAEYISKHKPQAGGYYVVYKDGYESWSPAEAFEGGYTKIKEEE